MQLSGLSSYLSRRSLTPVLTLVEVFDTRLNSRGGDIDLRVCVCVCVCVRVYCTVQVSVSS